MAKLWKKRGFWYISFVWCPTGPGPQPPSPHCPVGRLDNKCPREGGGPQWGRGGHGGGLNGHAVPSAARPEGLTRLTGESESAGEMERGALKFPYLPLPRKSAKSAGVPMFKGAPAVNSLSGSSMTKTTQIAFSSLVLVVRRVLRFGGCSLKGCWRDRMK